MLFARVIPTLALIATFGFPLAGGAQTVPAPGAAASPPSAQAGPAQPAVPPSGHRHHEPFMHALRALHLTPDQRRQVAAFRADEQQANVNADPATRKANALKMRQQIRSILTPDQKTQLAARLQHPRKHRQDAGSAPNPAPTPGAN